MNNEQRPLLSGRGLNRNEKVFFLLFPFTFRVSRAQINQLSIINCQFSNDNSSVLLN